MANLKEIRTRISSVKTTRQVTSAMKMLSAVKLKKAQDAILQIRPYAEKLSELLSTLSSSLDGTDLSAYTEQREPDKVLVILVSSNRGLCGGFNSYVSKKAIELAYTKYNRQLKTAHLHFFAIGKSGEKFLKSKGHEVIGTSHQIFDELNFENTAIIASEVMKQFVSGKYDRIELVYNQFKNAATQEQVSEQFLPVLAVGEEGSNRSRLDYIYEPSVEYIVSELIPRSLKIQLYKTLLDSNAAEHGARMTAMHKATDNATELIRDLTLTFNKARQAAITNQILEVTNGAEALNG